jgi:hypothetical protein
MASLLVRRDLIAQQGETTVIEFVNGYRQPSGAVHVYDPFAALKGNDDD